MKKNRQLTRLSVRVRNLRIWLNAKKYRIAVAAVIPVVVIALALTFSMKRSYSLNMSVTHSVCAIPEDAVWYMEILRPQELYSVFESSQFGKSIIGSKTWEKLSGTPEFHKLSDILYFIELKAGMSISYKEIPSFLGGSAGVAGMRDGSMLIVARTNLKSKFTVSLLSAFKGKKMPLSEAAKKKPGDGKKLEGITAESYIDIFGEENVPFANLTVTRINSQKGFLYLVMMEDYLFISDSADTLKESLYLATQNNPSSLKNLKGMTEAAAALESGGHILFYTDAKRSAAAPLIASLVKSDTGAAIVLYPDKAKGLTGDIFAVGDMATAPAVSATDFSRIIPLDSAAVLYSQSAGIPDTLSSFNTLDKKWTDLKEGSRGFFTGADIDPDEYFEKNTGCAIVFHSLDIIAKKPYPQFSLAYTAKQTGTAIAKAIFKTGEETASSFQGVTYTSLASKQHKYSPSFFQGKASVISSDRKFCEAFISASKGNRPVIADDPSYAALGEFAAAPSHLIISIPKMTDVLKSFFYYGAQRNGGYTSVTVDRDILPLTEPLAHYGTLHIATGLPERKTGRLILTEKK